MVEHKKPRKIFLEDIFFDEHLKMSSATAFFSVYKEFRKVAYIFNYVNVVELGQKLDIAEPHN